MLSIWLYHKMSVKYTPSGGSFSSLILEVFRLNGRLLVEGDRLMRSVGLTSARWQVLGAIATSPTIETVSGLARAMGLNRQGVQRIVDELAQEGIVELSDNPNHRRAKLVAMTANGRHLYDATFEIQSPWVNLVAEGMEAETINAASMTLRALRLRLDDAAFPEREMEKT